MNALWDKLDFWHQLALVDTYELFPEPMTEKWHPWAALHILRSHGLIEQSGMFWWLTAKGNRLAAQHLDRPNVLRMKDA